MFNIYVASSWRNKYQEDVVKELRQSGFNVYDFKNPEPGDHGFHWSDIDPEWKGWAPEQFIALLKHPIANSGFNKDMTALKNCDACVLVLPCGRSAHLEAGQAIGAGKHTIIYMPEPCEPELMYKMAYAVSSSLENVIGHLQRLASYHN